MAIYKRGKSKIWYISFTTPNGKRIRHSSGTTNKLEAQQLHDKLRAEAWRTQKLGETPNATWKDAAVKYLHKNKMSKSYKDIVRNIRQLDKFLGDKLLKDITPDLIDEIIEARIHSTFCRREGGKKYPVTVATVNRMLQTLRAVLNMAYKKLKWLEIPIAVSLIKVPRSEKERIRWITKEEAKRLLNELPSDLRPLASFALTTGLRESNITGLKWPEVSFEKATLVVYADETKNEDTLTIPLSNSALKILESQLGKHPLYVFTHEGQPRKRGNTAAWRKALDRAGIAPYTPPDSGNNKTKKCIYPTKNTMDYKYSDFRWHDLRHTWASWHVQAGTPLAHLQQLGGWKTFSMVLRYAHLGNSHLSSHANNISLDIEE